MVGEGFLGVLKILVAGQDNKYREGESFFIAFSRKLQAAHYRHLNVSDHDLGSVFLDHFIGGGPIGSSAYDIHVVGFPVDHGFDAGLYQRLIIRYQDVDHFSSPFFLKGSRMETVVNSPNLLSTESPYLLPNSY